MTLAERKRKAKKLKKYVGAAVRITLKNSRYVLLNNADDTELIMRSQVVGIINEIDEYFISLHDGEISTMSVDLDEVAIIETIASSEADLLLAAPTKGEH